MSQPKKTVSKSNQKRDDRRNKIKRLQPKKTESKSNRNRDERRNQIKRLPTIGRENSSRKIDKVSNLELSMTEELRIEKCSYCMQR